MAQDALLDQRRRYQRGMAALFIAAFGTIGIFNPFFPVWMKGEGLRSDQIAIVLAAQIALRVVVSPLILHLADRASDRASVLIATGFASAALVNLLWVASGFWAILGATVLIASFWSPVVPLSDTIALSGVRRLAADYGRARLWGSAAFIGANLFAGVVLSRYGTPAILPMLSGSFAAAAATMLLAPRLRLQPDASEGRGTRGLRPRAARTSLAARLRLAPKADIRLILPALLAVACVQASHAAFYAFASILWSGLGYSGVAIGFFWAVGVVAEVALFRQASGLVRRFGALRFLLVGGCAAILRWIASGWDLGFAGFALIQTTHGLTFGATHLALQSIIVGSVAEERFGAAQGAGFALQTGAMAMMTLACGPLFAAIGPRTFWLMAALAAAGVLLASQARFPATYPQSRQDGGATVPEE